MSYALVENEYVQVGVLVGVGSQNQFDDLANGEGELLSDLNHKLADGLQMCLLKEVPYVLLSLVQVLLLQGNQAFPYRCSVCFVD